ncbi:hypothetical protein BY458DRAFT_495893 [Sporodiniella umbellata]|nr:hypothetical protein BY458DRAFT_495893 [Sporodiniella umbellata]
MKRAVDARGPGSSKRVRFDAKTKASNSDDFEFDHQDELESKKSRRGAVNFDVYGSDDEEVGYNSGDSDDEGKQEEKEEETGNIGEDFDMFAETPKEKKKKPNPNTELEGQDFTSFDRDDNEEDDIENGVKKEAKISAFNMKAELEEGSLDDKGNYIRNKEDPQAFHDKWMEGITRKDINYAKEAQAKRAREEALKEAERQSELPQTQTDVYRALVEYIQPGQSVQEALTSLANSLPKKIPAWKQKMLDKKNKNKKQETAALSEEEEALRRKRVETITGLADQMMALGYFHVYEDTFEMMIRHLRKEGAVSSDWLPNTHTK